MSSVAQPLGAALPVADSLAPVLVVLLGGGLLGMSIRNMFESIMSEDEAPAGDADGGETSTDGGSGLMAESLDEDEGGDDDLGGLDGLDDEGDDLGGFDDDGFGEMDGDGADLDELDHRLDELEAEVGSLSSTVNTVRNENEQIADSVGEVEENVRKLLDIYEMVTRGVNPFADDVNAGMAGGMGDSGGFGLFADEDEPEPDGIDQDIAEADAEGFFDEDLVDDEEELEADADVGDVLGEDETEEFEDDFDEDFEEFSEEEADDGGGGGTSFQDLKDEYDSGDAEWTDEAEAGEDGEAAVDEELDDLAEDELFDDVVDEEVADETATDGDATDAAETTNAAPSASTADSADGRPYLATLPEGFAADLLVIEWLEFLVGSAGVRETARALDYYESIDWIAEPVADDLREYLAGFDGGGSATLTIDHHTRSLRYIGRLDGEGAETAALERLTHGGGSDGIQR